MGELLSGRVSFRPYITWILGAVVFSLVVVQLAPNLGQAARHVQLHLLPNDPAALAALFAPNLLFSNDEPFLPVPIEAMLENSDLKRGGEVILEAPISAGELSRYTSQEFYLDLRENSPGLTYESISSEYPATIYARIAQLSQGMLLQYWFFYLYNDGVNQHEGDWEVISFQVDGSGRPQVAAYSQHYTALLRHWTNVERTGSHPAVYVARGSHASYFAPGQHGLRSTPCGLTGLDSTTGLGGLEPRAYRIVLLADQPWLAFKGLWGKASESQPESGPPGPRFREDGCGTSLWSPPEGWLETLHPDNEFSLIPRRGSPPTPLINVSGSMARDQPLNFHGHDSIDDGEIIYWEWEMGDGSVLAGTEIQHTYAERGDYTVRLAIMDSEGNLNATHLVVKIGEARTEDETDGAHQAFESVNWLSWLIIVLFAVAGLIVVSYVFGKTGKEKPK